MELALLHRFWPLIGSCEMEQEIGLGHRTRVGFVEPIVRHLAHCQPANRPRQNRANKATGACIPVGLEGMKRSGHEMRRIPSQASSKVLMSRSKRYNAPLSPPAKRQLVEQFPGETFFFDLFRHVPLHEVVCGIIFQTQTRIHHIVDTGRNAGLVLKNQCKNLFQSIEIRLRRAQGRNQRRSRRARSRNAST